MPLNRTFYSIAVITSGLLCAVYLIQGIVYFSLGQKINGLATFFPWYVFYGLVFFLASLLYLKYYRLQNYTTSFWTALANLIASVITYIVFIGLHMGKTHWVDFHLQSELAVLATTILFAVSLIFSDAGKKRWLRLAGLALSVTSTTLLIAVIVYLNSMSADSLSSVELVAKWSSLLAWLCPLFITIHFMDEQKKLHPTEAEVIKPTSTENTISAMQIIAVLATLFFAFKLGGETVATVSWDRSVVKRTKEWNSVWAARTFVDAQGDTLRYQLIYPEYMDSTKTYPMVVCLPYGGGIEGSPAAQFLLTQENRAKYPSFLFVPFCTSGSGWGGIPNYPTMDTVVFESIEAVERENNFIDADRVYITGVSRGAYGSWHFISLRPDLFAAAMPVCGAGDPKTAANMVDVALWAFHGENDPGVPVSGSRDMIAAIKDHGGDPKYTEFPDSGHNIWHLVLGTPGVFEWLFQQKRTAE